MIGTGGISLAGSVRSAVGGTVASSSELRSSHCIANSFRMFLLLSGTAPDVIKQHRNAFDVVDLSMATQSIGLFQKC